MQIVEPAMFLVSLGATALLAVWAVRGYRSRRWGRLGLAAIGIAGLQFAGALLLGPQMRGYVYRTVDPHVTFLECSFKGLTYDSMLAQYRETKSETPLFRTFEQQWWNLYRWHDYVHHPRWKLPYRQIREPEPHLKVVRHAVQNGKAVVIFQAEVAGGRRVWASDFWRIIGDNREDAVLSKTLGAPAKGRFEFGVIAPTNASVWKLQVTLHTEALALGTRLQFMQSRWKSVTRTGTPFLKAAREALGVWSQFYATSSQTVESAPITNSAYQR